MSDDATVTAALPRSRENLSGKRILGRVNFFRPGDGISVNSNDGRKP